MDKSDLDARFKMVALIWTSLLGGVTFFTAAVLGLTTGVIGAWTPTLESGLAGTLLILPVSSMAAGIAFRRGDLRKHADPGQRLTAYQNQVIVGSALQEGGGLFGLALCLLAGQPSWALGVWVVTFVAMMLTRPTRDELDQLLR